MQRRSSTLTVLNGSRKERLFFCIISARRARVRTKRVEPSGILNTPSAMGSGLPSMPMSEVMRMNREPLGFSVFTVSVTMRWKWAVSVAKCRTALQMIWSK